LKVSPLSWDQYYDKSLDINIPDTKNVFRVYTGGKGPCTFLFIHGGGHSALSWAVVSSKLEESYGVIALDLRGHGATVTDNDKDLSGDTLVNDIILVVKTMYGGEKIPPLAVVGHSLGGALAVRVCIAKQLPVVGCAVVDVVEGSAIAALGSMSGIVESRPKTFSSIESAIQWSISAGVTRNVESACVSVPAQLKPITNDDGSIKAYGWRTDLLASEPHWKGWFVGLSEAFLKVPAAKLLIVAGTDRIDKDSTLIVGQMQGKYQNVVIASSGHCIQEDRPDQMIEELRKFAEWNRFGLPFVPPKKFAPTKKTDGTDSNSLFGGDSSESKPRLKLKERKPAVLSASSEQHPDKGKDEEKMK